MNSPATILWFRQDLRLADNPALRAAVARGAPVIPIFIWSPDEEGAWPPGGAWRRGRTGRGPKTHKTLTFPSNSQNRPKSGLFAG
jgi:hypothetical protein